VGNRFWEGVENRIVGYLKKVAQSCGILNCAEDDMEGVKASKGSTVIWACDQA
jgi:hypothetical protein